MNSSAAYTIKETEAGKVKQLFYLGNYYWKYDYYIYDYYIFDKKLAYLKINAYLCSRL